MKDKYNEISKYDIKKEKILDFLIDKQNSPDFYIFKNFIMDMAEIDNYEYLFKLYFSCEMCDNYEFETNDYYTEEYNAYNKVLKDYVTGNNSKEFLNFIAWLEDMAELFNGLDTTSLFTCFDQLSSSYEKISRYKKYINDDSNSERLKELEILIKNEETNIEKRKKEIRDNYEFKEAQNFDMNKIEKAINILEQLAIKKAKGDKFHQYISIGTFSEITNETKKLNDDFYFAYVTAQKFNDIVEYAKENPDFKSIINYIRQHIINYANSKRNEITNDFRVDNLDDDFIEGATSDFKEIENQFNNLSIKYNEIMKIDDKKEFIKKCADFHFDFLKIHPFMEANGRTSRILLKVMLALHDIYLPSLYITELEKYNFYTRSNDALKGIYKTTEDDLLNRVEQFYNEDDNYSPKI